jgi:hypothetical protein
MKDDLRLNGRKLALKLLQVSNIADDAVDSFCEIQVDKQTWRCVLWQSDAVHLGAGGCQPVSEPRTFESGMAGNEYALST